MVAGTTELRYIGFPRLTDSSRIPWPFGATWKTSSSSASESAVGFGVRQVPGIVPGIAVLQLLGGRLPLLADVENSREDSDHPERSEDGPGNGAVV